MADSNAIYGIQDAGSTEINCGKARTININEIILNQTVFDRCMGFMFFN